MRPLLIASVLCLFLSSCSSESGGNGNQSSVVVLQKAIWRSPDGSIHLPFAIVNYRSAPFNFDEVRVDFYREGQKVCSRAAAILREGGLGTLYVSSLKQARLDNGTMIDSRFMRKTLLKGDEFGGTVISCPQLYTNSSSRYHAVVRVLNDEVADLVPLSMELQP